MTFHRRKAANGAGAPPANRWSRFGPWLKQSGVPNERSTPVADGLGNKQSTTGRVRRSENARRKTGRVAGGKTGRKSACGRAAGQPGLLPEAYGEPVAALSLRFDAGGQGAFHPGRS